MDRVEFVAMLADELDRVALVELKRIPWLRPNVYANHVEAGSEVAHAGATGATEGVKESRTAHSTIPAP